VGGMISVLLATTGRPDGAEACVRSLIDTTDGHEIEIVAAIDDDLETWNRLAAIQPRQEVSIRVNFAYDYRGSSKAWNDALRLSTGDPVVLAADDLEFQPGWLDAALSTLSEFEGGWGFVGFNDGHWNGDTDFSTHYLMSRRFIAEHMGGVVAWDCYKHSFNDREANARARRAGRYAWCENARVTHNHWIFGDRAQDGTDTRLLGLHPVSERAFLYREAQGFPDDFEPVIT